MDARIVAEFNLYARTGPKVVGIEPTLIRLDIRRDASGSI
jgi:hypothetical protein